MKKFAFIIIVLSFLFILIYSANFYFLSRLSSSAPVPGKLKPTDVQSNYPGSLDESNLKQIYRIRSPKFEQVRNKLIQNLTPCERSSDFRDIWQAANKLVFNNEVYPQQSAILCQILKALQQAPLLSASNSRRGTQLKLNVTVEGNQTVFFKPAWYRRNRIIEGEIYSGKDRHNSEVAAFFLGAILNLRWTPIVVGRTISLQDVWNLADNELQETMSFKFNDSRICLYGKCYYCKPSEAVCGNKTHFVEGVLLYQIPGPLAKHKSPWQRTYKDGMKAAWETKGGNDYCDLVRTKLPMVRILDLIDAAVFDFLIQNGDRHHYETRQNRVVLIDNGKGFGNPYVDFIDILAPLYQCCIIRKTTFTRLLMFTGGSLSEMLKLLTKNDLLHPILTENHFAALERRLLKVFSVIEFCREQHGNSIFK